jgi:NAD(P)-dependent dehydrogenase (short-subunit alcohol dehydrogenase family)
VSSDGGIYLITGGAGGLGSAVARRLIADGHRVALADRDEARLENVARELGDATSSFTVDLSDGDACVGLVSRIAEGGVSIKGVAACAGLLGSFDRASQTRRQWDDVLALNARASYLVTDAVAARIVADGGTGSAVLVSSGAARFAIGIPAYSASKGAVEGVMRELSLRWAPEGVRFNVVAPGAMNTEMLGDARSDPELMAQLVARVSLGRVGEPEEIASVIAFLLSDDASYVTGATLDVDGGYTSH